MKLHAIRTAFLDYFAKNNHTIVPSSPLVPFNDDTLLFTNAGMVQFKEVFLGQDQLDYKRAVSAQRCVRAGGKHNDLDNVGYTARHHTFFEMMGNFSFGDYFKQEAIQFAWIFLTKELGIPAEKLWVTIYHEDQEAEDIWLKQLKIDPERFSRCGDKDNFWAMGETGPCGPCSEIFYDHGESVAGGPPGTPEEEGDRYVEIWNLVFMQYNRDKEGNLTPLPNPAIDTGMGLERMAAVLQGVHSNYDIDLFQVLIKKAQSLLPGHELDNKSYRVLADHIRATAFLILDGIVPSNEGRGYVLRRIMRRALRHGGQLGAKEAFFYKMVGTLCDEMGQAYPELKAQRAHIEKIVLKEEEQFEKTLEQGLKILANGIAESKAVIDGELAFKLYDTYGFPIDLTADVAREHQMSVDIGEFERLMQAQKERARASSQFNVDYNQQLNIDVKTTFTGYQSLKDSASVIALFKDNEAVDALYPGDSGVIVLDKTPFYAESGGQVGDQGELDFSTGSFLVKDTQKSQNAILHIGEVQSGTIKNKMAVEAQVSDEKRMPTKANHSATHLLHAALRQVLGKHVTQKGSLVTPDRLRFDFSHFEPLSAQQIADIEAIINQKILENSAVSVTEMPFDQAIEQGVMALFGEKYEKDVRVLEMGDGFSKELCGGTHVSRTGDIGLFVIVQEMGVAAGVRRIEALTGKGAFAHFKHKSHLLTEVQSTIKADDQTVLSRTAELVARIKTLEKQTEQLKHKLATQTGGDVLSDVQVVGDVKLLVKRLEGLNPKLMRQLMDDLKNKIQSGVVVLATVANGKVQLIVGVTKDCTHKILAGELVKFLAEQVGGSGGGRADMAQAGGSKPEGLDKALASVLSWVEEKIKS